MHLVEKRAQKAIFDAKFKAASIAVVDDGSCASKVNVYLVQNMLNLANTINIVKKLPELSQKYDFVSVPDTADYTAEKFLEFVLNAEFKPSKFKLIRLLSTSMLVEVQAFAKLKGITYKIPQNQPSDIAILLEKLEIKYKGSIHGISNSSAKLLSM